MCTSPQDRAALLRACVSTTMAVAEEAAAAGTDAKGSYGQGIGEELVVWVSVLLVATGAPAAGCCSWCSCCPCRACICISFAGWQSAAPCPLVIPTAHAMQVPVVSGLREYAVALVLGAGNQLPVVVLDILHKLVSGPGLSAATSLHLPAPASAPFPCPWPAVERQPCAPAGATAPVGYAASSP